MLQRPDLEVVARDPLIPGLAVVLDRDAVAALIGPSDPVHLRYKPGVSCIATYRTDAGFVCLRAVTRGHFPALVGRKGLTLLAPEAIAIQPMSADRKLRLKAVGDLRVLRFKPERRAVLRSDGAMVKIMSAKAWPRAVAGAAFGASFGGPQLLRIDEDRRWIETAWLDGSSAEDADVAVFERIGARLADLHGNSADLPELPDAGVPAALGDLVRIAPAFAGQAGRIRERLKQLLVAGRIAPCHGDFSADQVMIADGVRFVDWDEAGMGDPARDIGTFLARLDQRAVLGEIDADRATAQGDAFLHGYGVPPGNIWAHHGRALAALATEAFRLRRDDWPNLTSALLDRAEKVLDSAVARAADAATVADLSGLPITRAEPMRLKSGKRALFRYRGQGIDLVGKVRFKGADARTPELHTHLRANGLDGADGAAVPACRKLIGSINLWLQDVAAGQVLADLVEPGGPTHPVHVTGRALARLHRAPILRGRVWTMADEVAVMHRALAPIEAARGLAAALAAKASALPDAPSVGLHRDFHPDQIILGKKGISLLDLDLYAEGDAAVDIGNFLAHLDELAFRNHWPPSALEPHRRAFLAGYAAVSPLPDAYRIAVLHEISLARHIAISGRMAGRHHESEMILSHLLKMG